MSALYSIPEIQAVSDANSLLTVDLHHALKPDHPGNIIYSPFSLSAVVAMAKVGAKGSTADEITAGCHFPTGNDILSTGYSKVLKSLEEETDDYILSVANRIYSQTGFEHNAEFGNILKNSFHTEAQQLDFVKNIQSAVEINTWVEKTTHNKIKNLIDPNALNANTRIVLVNGIYFKGQWAKKFNTLKTKNLPFHINETEDILVDMMEFTEKVPYAEIEELNADVVALPYKGDRLCMLFLIPREKTGLAKIEAGLQNLTPTSILPRLDTYTEICFSLPKFKLETSIHFTNTMKKLGMKSMFNETHADFSGISLTRLHISQIIQKAFIEVNEEGSEAAAATGMIFLMSSSTQLPPKIVHVKANRPFFFQIIDKETNFVLFSGACVNPLNN